MVSFYSAVAAAVVGVLSFANPSDALFPGLYFRPPSVLVSGEPGNTKAPFRRTPCPALNALANHGYLPRDGKNLTTTVLRDVVMDKFNLDLGLATLLVSVLPQNTTFDLNILGTHNLVEHDASLVHVDSYTGVDPSKVDKTLLKDVLSRANSSTPFSVATFGQIRKERIATCKAQNPNCTFGPTQVFLAFGESSLILQGFGNATSETARYEDVRSFLEFEKFPATFKKPATVISRESLAATSAKIQAIANAA